MHIKTRVSLQEFIKKHGIKFTAQEVTTRPDNLMGDSAFHFKCRIWRKHTAGFRSHTVYFSKGSGLGPSLPEASEVLDCLASDASRYENAQSFEDWASEYGYDEDSRAAEKIWRQVKRQSEQLKRTLGTEAYEELLWNTERL